MAPEAVGVGEPSAAPRPEFAEFFDRTWGPLTSFCATLTGSAQVAEEIAQETLTRVYARYPLIGEPRPYAFRVAANLVRRSWRDAQRAKAVEAGAAQEGVASPYDPAMLDAVRRLPPRLSAVVLLHYYADLPVAAVAQVVHRPVGTVKRRLHEARAALAVVLTEEES